MRLCSLLVYNLLSWTLAATFPRQTLHQTSTLLFPLLLATSLSPHLLLPTSSTPSYHVVTRSQTGHLRPCTYPDFHLYYSTRHPLPTLHASVIISEPCSYAQAAAIPE
ncbi:hypothetical protein CK203_105790 [Vitis vinifera]|uniref:Secreted protein n=1 Tax=Vitis vinifera TaxID=29760 RepID=A0A438D7P7_VITVI|nr:hypothetical protein CK203_105790 [Vitis vinifera]